MVQELILTTNNMQTEKYLFLDDIRHPYDAFNYTKQTMFLQKEWIIVRDYNQFVEHIIENGLPYFIAFDHDLADEHYDYDDVKTGKEYKEKTGLDCAKWLVDHCIDNNLDLPQYFVHSQNPVGKDNIIGYFESYLKNKSRD
jgi:hypothetical protein